MSTSKQPPTPERVRQLRWIARVGAVTPEALAAHDQLTLGSARARLGASARLGLLACSRPLAGQPALFTLTRAGLSACGLAGEVPRRVSPTNAAHTIVCAAVAVALERCYPDHEVCGESELRRRERCQGRALASASLRRGAGGEPMLHRPDLALWPVAAGALPVVVEVELTVKAPRRLAQICRSWARCREIAGVLYLVTPEAQRAVERAVQRAHAADRVVVLGLGALPRSPGTLGGVNLDHPRVCDHSR